VSDANPGRRPLGRTGLVVSAVGLGAGRLGDASLGEREAEALLRGALDLGISLFDAAPSYGLAEDRIGRHLADRRSSFVLSTKLGYGVEGIPDWTGPCITAGVERALRILRTDVIDVAHLHSCPRAVLEQGEVVEALRRAVEAGKVRAAGYSGEGDALAWAVRSGAFAVVQASVSLCDPGSSRGILREARERGLGVLAKRPLAGAPWRPGAAVDDATRCYAHRWRALALPIPSGQEMETALRFCLHHADAALLGTRRLDALRDAVEAALGPLEDGWRGLIEATLTARAGGWEGQVLPFPAQRPSPGRPRPS
jgi:aryl-alcohol dehydrogenase-like predicted oxidoreductase